jgi:glycerol kinase
LPSICFKSDFPRPGWVEQDAEEIWQLTRAAAGAMVDQAGGASRIAAIGITNQRETIVFWDRRNGRALAPAIVWQDRRTASFCDALKQAGHEPALQAATGLLLDPYFSASKIRWALDHWPQLKKAGDNLAIGTIDSWLIFRLTGGLHVSDATNASRTALMASPAAGTTASLICSACRTPPSRRFATAPASWARRLPTISAAPFRSAASPGTSRRGNRPGLLHARRHQGDLRYRHLRPHPRRRHAAGFAPPLAGHGCVAAWRCAALCARRVLFVAGSMMQWLRDQLGLIGSAAESETLARSVTDSGRCYHRAGFYRAWRAALGSRRARRHTRPDPWCRPCPYRPGGAGAVANQTFELQRAFAADGTNWSSLRIDGGMSANGFLAQNLADLLALEVERPVNIETTALGAAMLAGVGAGLFDSLDEAASAVRGQVSTFRPEMDASVRTSRVAAWDQAVAGRPQPQLRFNVPSSILPRRSVSRSSR